MSQNVAFAGECIYEKIRLEYQVVQLEFIVNKKIDIEAICYNPYGTFDKELTFKYSSNNINYHDEKLKISLAIISSLIKNLDLQEDKLCKLIIKNNNVFFIHKL